MPLISIGSIYCEHGTLFRFLIESSVERGGGGGGFEIMEKDPIGGKLQSHIHIARCILMSSNKQRTGAVEILLSSLLMSCCFSFLLYLVKGNQTIHILKLPSN